MKARLLLPLLLAPALLCAAGPTFMFIAGPQLYFQSDSVRAGSIPMSPSLAFLLDRHCSTAGTICGVQLSTGSLTLVSSIGPSGRFGPAVFAVTAAKRGLTIGACVSQSLQTASENELFITDRRQNPRGRPVWGIMMEMKAGCGELTATMSAAGAFSSINGWGRTIAVRIGTGLWTFGHSLSSPGPEPFLYGSGQTDTPDCFETETTSLTLNPGGGSLSWTLRRFSPPAYYSLTQRVQLEISRGIRLGAMEIRNSYTLTLESEGSLIRHSLQSLSAGPLSVVLEDRDISVSFETPSCRVTWAGGKLSAQISRAFVIGRLKLTLSVNQDRLFTLKLESLP